MQHRPLSCPRLVQKLVLQIPALLDSLVLNQKLTEKDDFELIIQVNGKVRGKENIAKALTEDEIKEISLKNKINHLEF